MSQGIDKVFPEPAHEIRGATKADQDWIDEVIAAGQSCCDWTVKPRPAQLDRPKAVPAKKPAARKKRSLFRRLTS